MYKQYVVCITLYMYYVLFAFEFSFSLVRHDVFEQHVSFSVKKLILYIHIAIVYTIVIHIKIYTIYDNMDYYAIYYMLRTYIIAVLNKKLVKNNPCCVLDYLFENIVFEVKIDGKLDE